MPTVHISYDPDLSKIGTIQEVSADEARRLVRRGRATYTTVTPTVAEPVVVADLPVSGQPEDAAVDDDEPAVTSLDLDED